MEQYRPVGWIEKESRMDRHNEYYESFYEDLRPDYGDTEYTADLARDLANEQVQEDNRDDDDYYLDDDDSLDDDDV